MGYDNLRAAEQRARDEDARGAEEERQAQARRDEARRAEEVRKLKVAEELKSVEHHSKTAAGIKGGASKKESSIGFDTKGKYSGGLDAVEVEVGGSALGKEPVIPEGKRTKAITKLEKKRNILKAKRK